jgi:hypothetical protein
MKIKRTQFYRLNLLEEANARIFAANLQHSIQLMTQLLRASQDFRQFTGSNRTSRGFERDRIRDLD